MKKNIITIALLALSTSLIGCGDLGFDFDFTHDSPEYVIVAEESSKADGALETDALSFPNSNFRVDGHPLRLMLALENRRANHRPSGVECHSIWNGRHQ